MSENRRGRRAGTPVRNLVLVLGDQLATGSAALAGFDNRRDAIWMAEVEQETTHVPAHKLRIAAFFSAMRHFREEQRRRGREVYYTELTARRSEDRGRGFADVLRRSLRELKPERLVMIEPGDVRVRQALETEAAKRNAVLEIRPDDHFLCTTDEFAGWMSEHQRPVMEGFYRWMRGRTGVLLRPDGAPVGGEWNFDPQNRESLKPAGPRDVRPPRAFTPDDVTRGVIELVSTRYARHPGSLDHFRLPVTAAQANSLLHDFVTHRLPRFGPFQDAMWADEPFLFHSRLSFPLNTKLLSPRACLDAAVSAHRDGAAPIQSVEGFVRQILGWREFIRGIYWQHAPGYLEMNALECEDTPVPRFFWDGNTDMNCVRHAMRSVIDHAYAHHTHRLMVLGNFSMLSGVHPRRFHEWHLAMYADAVDWVSAPNAIGMSQYGDGGIVGTKPYPASGSYINRMSNYCVGCRYDPRRAEGDDACPFTTLYWDFLARHRQRFARQARMAIHYPNLKRKPAGEIKRIRARADTLKARVAAGERI